MNVQIEQLTEKELDKFYNLFSKLIKSEFPDLTEKIVHYILNNKRAWTKSSYKYSFKIGGRILLGAFESEKLVGIVDAWLPFGGVSFLNWLLVDGTYQRQGIGRKLLKELENIFKKHGGHSIYIYTAERNIPFYQKQGFELIGMYKKSWYGLDKYIMSKLIQEPREENFLK